MSDISKPLTKPQFETLFREEISRLHNFAKQYVYDHDAAMDICQNVFVTLWERREDLDTQGNVRSYLYTSVRNRCLNYLRDQKKYRSRILDLDCGELEFACFNDEETGAEELERQIKLTLETLPEKCRQVFEMSRLREMKYREIADELGISQKTVEAHMSKAIRTLREALTGYLSWILAIGYFFLEGIRVIQTLCVLILMKHF